MEAKVSTAEWITAMDMEVQEEITVRQIFRSLALGTSFINVNPYRQPLYRNPLLEWQE